MVKRREELQVVTIIAFVVNAAAGCGANTEAPSRDTASVTTAVRTGASTTPGDPCTLFGSWSTVSQPWNGKSSASVITFGDNGIFAGVPTYSGDYSFDGTNLVIWNTAGTDMNCGFEAKWIVQLDTACTTATLLPQSDGCTGARRYLDWNVKLVRY